ncbi:DUF1501 domain-containing protein [Sodalis sp. dw_96]|uniref:DUF1501 domain-containing protein n=1 Tax=Sodalis sp. dw_96 TaxID=2719794 RepID=UPI001BD5B068|nr:DUF1501 domain-containing protein [Sodalis sp. dw_96]
MQRRDFLRCGVIAAAGALFAPRVVFANAATERRFVFIIQRGAADGLDTVIPFADPDYARLRGAAAVESPLRLDGTFALHPALAETAKLYNLKQALFMHAVASPYRDRSHFDGQNILETGGTLPYQLKTGWLNRLLSLLPPPDREAIALSPTVPLALRGPIDVISYAPSSLPQTSDDLLLRVAQLYQHDQQLHGLWSEALNARNIAGDMNAGNGRSKQIPEEIGRMAANFLSRRDGPRIAMIETGGWDTHTAQTGRLSGQLKSLDMLVASLRAGLADEWNNTTVMVATEFGRTAAANGTGGTDHGTGSVAMLFGGAVKGGRVLADWPGLSPGALYQGRDLKPTLALDALVTAVVSECFSLDPKRAGRVLFPAMASANRPMAPLLNL